MHDEIMARIDAVNPRVNAYVTVAGLNRVVVLSPRRCGWGGCYRGARRRWQRHRSQHQLHRRLHRRGRHCGKLGSDVQIR